MLRFCKHGYIRGTIRKLLFKSYGSDLFSKIYFFKLCECAIAYSDLCVFLVNFCFGLMMIRRDTIATAKMYDKFFKAKNLLKRAGRKCYFERE